MKKFQSILAVLLAVSLLACPASALSFPDVDSNSGYAPAIQFVSTIGIMVGDSTGNFNPNQIVNRAEMATIVCRVLKQTENLSMSNVFTDVPANHWANAYVGKASELGIVGGYGNGRFGPGDSVTYEQAVTMIVRAIGEGDRANSNGGYPNGYLQVAQEKNLLNGIQAVQGQGLSRGAVAMLLYNYYVALNNPSTPVEEHTHNWATRHVDEVGHTESSGTHEVTWRSCGCGFNVRYDDPDWETKWYKHKDPITGCRKGYTVWTTNEPNDPQYIVDTPAHDETYCTICGEVQ